MEPMPKVLIVDPNDPFRQTLKSLLVLDFPPWWLRKLSMQRMRLKK
jgi:hypothetical protein